MQRNRPTCADKDIKLERNREQRVMRGIDKAASILTKFLSAAKLLF